MRVIAGSARGVTLQAPRDALTRPITDRVKETLFGILGSRVPEARMLDLYAGSGAIGIEALSRGAERATFVERGAPALKALRANLDRTRLVDRATVIAGEVLTFLDRDGARGHDLAILDPPYEERAILAPLQRLAEQMELGGTVVVKHFWRTLVPEAPGLVQVRVRRFGETTLTFLERRVPDAHEPDAEEPSE
jgi:16S rRNA (guanine966-N2)-methyltransferase